MHMTMRAILIMSLFLGGSGARQHMAKASEGAGRTNLTSMNDMSKVPNPDMMARVGHYMVEAKSTVNAEAAAAKFVKRQCVTEIAKKFEALRKELTLPIVQKGKTGAGLISYDLDSNSVKIAQGKIQTPEGNRQTLPESLVTWYDLKDQSVAAKSDTLSDVLLERRTRQAKDVLKAYGFSTTSAEVVCELRAAYPPADETHQCILEALANKTTYKSKTGGLLGHTAQTLEEQDDESIVDLDQLPGKLEELWGLEERVLLLTQIATEALQKFWRQVGRTSVFGSVYPVKAEITKAQAELDVAKVHVKSTGFSRTHTTKYCVNKLMTLSPREGQESMQRILEEVTSVVQKQDFRQGGNHIMFPDCTEVSDAFCPEGTSPQLHRDFHPENGVVVLATAPVWGNIVSIAAFATVGLVMGGPPGAAAGVASAALTPTEWILGVPAAILASIDWLPQCRCFPDVCKLEEGTCQITPHEYAWSTKNPFRWLPYNGNKCAPKPGTIDSCALQPCTKEDITAEVPQVEGLRGRIGHVPSTSTVVGGVYNCLTLDGTPLHPLLSEATLTMLDGQPVNDPPNRNVLFEKLGLEPISPESVPVDFDRSPPASADDSEHVRSLEPISPESVPVDIDRSRPASADDSEHVRS